MDTTSTKPAPTKPSKSLGVEKILAVFLDTERAAQWLTDWDFRRALCENLADEAPSADRVFVYRESDRKVLVVFRPEDYLNGEATVRILIPSVPPVRGPVTRPGNLPPPAPKATAAARPGGPVTPPAGYSRRTAREGEAAQ